MRARSNPAGVTCTSCEFGCSAVAIHKTLTMRDAGLALVPDHRMENALIGEWSLRENLAMVHPQHAVVTTGVLSRRREEAEAQRVMKLMNVKAHSSAQELKTLSGGNKQKISIGKWLYGAQDRYRIMIFIERRPFAPILDHGRRDR